MSEPGNAEVPWSERMTLLLDSTQQRVLTAPMPDVAMEQLLADGKARKLGPFKDSPVHYMNRWWRPCELVWVALDEDATTELDRHAERYRAAISATAPDGPRGTPPPTAASSSPEAGE
ncbi:hypothetical protein OG458_41645 (plasmid) [Streptomyces sp. NBC_01281]|uniref:hypothetical protein n=1 Tax=Streptomyces sp. NBC_01281 TaxID=2903811 RepID=UPI002E1543A1|nr:hypothetical protein OG458_41645 [Streptomyces sp. NBC_01281]